MIVIPDMIWLEKISGERYPVRLHGRDPEEVAAKEANDIGQPVKVVKQGDKEWK